MIFDPDHVERFDEYGPTRPILEGEQFVSAKDYDCLLRLYRMRQNIVKSMAEILSESARIRKENAGVK